jgi:hypothetical protein
MESFVSKRHIADAATSNSTIQPHWGYVVRILPCTNDAGSCEYLDAVYWMHDISMLYTFILWAAIGFVLISVATLRACFSFHTKFYAQDGTAQWPF